MTSLRYAMAIFAISTSLWADATANLYKSGTTTNELSAGQTYFVGASNKGAQNAWGFLSKGGPMQIPFTSYNGINPNTGNKYYVTSHSGQTAVNTPYNLTYVSATGTCTPGGIITLKTGLASTNDDTLSGTPGQVYAISWGASCTMPTYTGTNIDDGAGNPTQMTQNVTLPSPGSFPNTSYFGLARMNDSGSGSPHTLNAESLTASCLKLVMTQNGGMPPTYNCTYSIP